MRRLYAFQVSPRRTVSYLPEVLGGPVRPGPDLLGLLDELIPASQIETQSIVHLRSDDPETDPFRNEIRNHFLAICFGSDSQATSGAEEIAAKLSLSMDHRSSKFSLLVIDAHEQKQNRRIALWLFPKEDVFRFHTSAQGNELSLLEDAFSKSSTWRKAAIFSGPNSAHGFRTGQIIDIQSRKPDDRAADFWMRLFLNALYAMDPKSSTYQLVNLLKDAFDASSGTQRDQLFAAMVALPRSPEKIWTYSKIADRFLEPNLQYSFLKLIPETVHHAHGDYFDEEFIRAFWKPLFESGRIAESAWEENAPKPNRLIETISFIPLKTLILLGLLALSAWWFWRV